MCEKDSDRLIWDFEFCLLTVCERLDLLPVDEDHRGKHDNDERTRTMFTGSHRTFLKPVNS